MDDETNTSTSSTRIELMRQDIPGSDNMELVLCLLTLPPGAAAPAHRHPGIGAGYVLTGTIESQYEGEELKIFHAGDAIYDLADTPHLIGRNGSQTEPMSMTMTFVVPKGSPTAGPL